MKMKRNVLALAISSGMVMAPAAAMAEGPEVYGLIDIGLEHYTDSDGAAGSEIFQGFNSAAGNSDDRDVALSNGMTSRLGVRGSEDLDFGGLGLVASYNIELQMDVLSDGRNNQNTRLGWAALGGDWGQVKVGSQWQALYEFGGWNTHRTDVHGYGTYYYTTELLDDSLQYGFRQDSAISYEYGSAWGHSDPFAVKVTLGIGEGSNSIDVQEPAQVAVNDDGDALYLDGNGDITTEEDDALTRTGSESVSNEEGITSIQIAGQYSFDQRISVNGVYIRQWNTYAGGGALNHDPELFNVGARYSVTDALELAVNYTQADRGDEDSNKRDSVAIASMMDFGNGLTGHLGFATGSDDLDEADGGYDIDLNTYGYIKQALSDRTSVRLELENVQYDNADDSSATMAMVGLQHSF